MLSGKETSVYAEKIRGMENKRMISVRRGGKLFLIHLEKTDDNSTLKEILARK